MKRFTIGITTHNEESTINRLLDSLLDSSVDDFDIILYDDCSTDGTRDAVESHLICTRKNFKSYFSQLNAGTPSVGRTYISLNSKTEYVILVDGDDFIDLHALKLFIVKAPSGYDIILSPFVMRGKIKPVRAREGSVAIDNDTVLRVFSGIGGRAYRSTLVAQYGQDPIKARSDDVRLNMRILLAGHDRIYYIANTPFYIIENSRKSTKAKNINLNEIAQRIHQHNLLMNRYNFDSRYLFALRKSLVDVIDSDPSYNSADRDALRERLWSLFQFTVRRIVFLVTDISVIGGVPDRLKEILASSEGRNIAYFCISSINQYGFSHPRCLILDEAKEDILARVSGWSEADTVFVTANNTVCGLPKEFRSIVMRYPIIHMCTKQLAFLIQNSAVLYDDEYVSKYKASAIICFSQKDIDFQRQLGIYEQVKCTLPVAVRQENSFDLSRNKSVGYVGRIDLAAKGCDRLIEIARETKIQQAPPIKIFTTSDQSSPDYNKFRKMIVESGVERQFDFFFEVDDKSTVFSQLKCMLLPSRQEAFGSVILEAFSFGVPVIGTSHAPGPSEIIRHGETGFLVDDFAPKFVMPLLQKMEGEMLVRLSRSAFEFHKDFSMENHLKFLENLGDKVVEGFSSENKLQVFPRLNSEARRIRLSSGGAGIELNPFIYKKIFHETGEIRKTIGRLYRKIKEHEFFK